MPILYHTAESVCSQKVRIGLAEAGVNFDSHIINFAMGEQHSETFRALNPMSVVPVLVDADIVVRESSLILQYIDETHCDAAFMPKVASAKVRAQLSLLQCLDIHAAINSVTFATTIRALDQKRTPEERTARWERIADPLIGRKRRDLFENGLQSVYVASAVKFLRQIIDEMSDAISVDGWLAGNSYSLADMAFTAYFDRLDRLGLFELWGDGAANVDGWLKRVRARKSYEKAVIGWVGAPPSGSERSASSMIWNKIL